MLTLHFDTPEHKVELAALSAASMAIDELIFNLSTTVFGISAGVEVHAVAIDEGGFTLNINIGWKTVAIPTVLAGFFHLSESGVVNGFIKGLTGKDIPEYSEQLGSTLRQWSESRADYDLIQPDYPTYLHEEAEEAAGNLLSDLTAAFLEADNETVRQYAQRTQHVDEAIVSRKKFFEACLEDPAIRAVGFSAANDFPIQRTEFLQRAAMPLPTDSSTQKIRWQVITQTILATSPNWDRADQKLRRWKGKTISGSTVFFSVDDDLFWEEAEKGGLYSDTINIMDAQVLCAIVDERTIERIVVKVVTFNGQEISSPLSREEIEEMIEALTEPDDDASPRPHGPQPSLF